MTFLSLQLVFVACGVASSPAKAEFRGPNAVLCGACASHAENHRGMRRASSQAGKMPEKVYSVGKDGLTIDAKISQDSPKVKFEPVGQGKEAQLPAIRYLVKLSAGKKYQLTMDSDDVDSVLIMKDSKGKQVAWDDDGGGGFSALIVLDVTKDHTYSVYAATLKGSGAFRLRIIELPPKKE